MATISKDNGSEWRASGVQRRDFRSSKDEPEVPKKGPRAPKAERLRWWCRGKEGQEHTYRLAQHYSLMRRSWDTYRCARCGKKEWRGC